ncbi:NUDIX domain-containing protein [Brevibacterium salitolerans]|jgi:8-oxo-dGTP diphosphatase|uniref:NUDIX domain-containing protein n=1 Tax=Brevibacterium salitolerans TaxID=1403566 RepID=A0ABN2X5I4_9MICO
MLQDRTIVVAALAIVSGGELLTVRKRGTTSFMLPGGKLEPGETAAEAVVREVEEELGLSVGPEEIVPVGRFSAAAANEPGHVVQSSVFTFADAHRVLDPARLRATAEIEELAWLPLHALPADTAERQLAPLTREHVVPALLEAHPPAGG